MNINFSVFIALLFIYSWSQASDESVFTEKARTRQYAGGPDESDLKVQAQVMKLQKSKNETNVEDEEGF